MILRHWKASYRIKRRRYVRPILGRSLKVILSRYDRDQTPVIFLLSHQLDVNNLYCLQCEYPEYIIGAFNQLAVVTVILSLRSSTRPGSQPKVVSSVGVREGTWSGCMLARLDLSRRGPVDAR
jgi:hypothetical protein